MLQGSIVESKTSSHEQWLLLAGGEGKPGGQVGRAFRLINGRFGWGGYGQRIEVMKVEGAAELRPSAEHAAGVGYAQLWRAGYMRRETTARFRVEGLDTRVFGHSADLLFALALMGGICGNGKRIPDFAATGTLTSSAEVGKVEGLAAKLDAAPQVLTVGGVVFLSARERV